MGLINIIYDLRIFNISNVLSRTFYLDCAILIVLSRLYYLERSILNVYMSNALSLACVDVVTRKFDTILSLNVRRFDLAYLPFPLNHTPKSYIFICTLNFYKYSFSSIVFCLFWFLTINSFLAWWCLLFFPPRNPKLVNLSQLSKLNSWVKLY